MNSPSELPLFGFVNPRGQLPAFLVPIFGTGPDFWIQDGKGDDLLVRFFPCTVPLEQIVVDHRPAVLARVGDALVYAFQFQDTEIVIGPKFSLQALLNDRLDEFRDFPFLLIDILKFTGNAIALSRAIHRAGQKMAVNNPTIAGRWTGLMDAVNSGGSDSADEMILEETSQRLGASFCAKCGGQTKYGSAFCSACGALLSGSGPTMEASPTGSRGYPRELHTSPIRHNLAGLLCYLFGFITGMIFLSIEPYKRDRFVRFHAFQSIFFSGAIVAVWIALTIAYRVLRVVTGGIPTVITVPISVLILLFFVGCWIVLMLKAYRNEEHPLPLVGNLAKAFAVPQA